jgi:hypothetical protein
MPSFKKKLIKALSISLAFTTITSLSTITIASAVDTRCETQPNYLLESPDIWESKNTKDLIYKVYWNLRDPESCITGIGTASATLSRRSFSESVPTNFSFERKNNIVVVSSQIRIDPKTLESLSNKDIDRRGLDILGGIEIEVEIIRDEPKGKNSYVLKGDYSLKNLWSDWFAKAKGTFSESCANLLASGQNKGNTQASARFVPSGEYSFKSIANNVWKFQLVIPNADCIDLVYTGPMATPSYGSMINNDDSCGMFDRCAISYGGAFVHANYPFWVGTSSEYFSKIFSDNSFVRVVAAKCFPIRAAGNCNDQYAILDSEQKLSRVGNSIVIDISIQQSALEPFYQDKGNLYFIHGSYSRYYKDGFIASSAWTTTCTTSGNIIRCRSTKGSGNTYPASTEVAWQSTVFEIQNFFKLRTLEADQAAQKEKETKAKAEADAKAKSESERLVRQEGICNQYNSDVRWLLGEIDRIRSLNPTRFRSLIRERYSLPMGEQTPDAEVDKRAPLALLLSREVDCYRYGQVMFGSDAYSFEQTSLRWKNMISTDKKSLIALENDVRPAKKITITCAKGTLIKKVTAVNPKCPAGYKKK